MLVGPGTLLDPAATGWPMVAGGLIASVGYLIGRLAGGPVDRGLTDVAVALALSIAFVVATGSARLFLAGKGSLRSGIEMFASMVGVSAVTFGAETVLRR